LFGGRKAKRSFRPPNNQPLATKKVLTFGPVEKEPVGRERSELLDQQPFLYGPKVNIVWFKEGMEGGRGEAELPFLLPILL
jgi:hypothetical protein